MENKLKKRLTLKIVGIGTCGSIIVGNLMESQMLPELDFQVVNSDRQVLDSSKVQSKLHLKPDMVDGPDRSAANEQIMESIVDSDLVILVAGMGGSTGTTLSLQFARIAKFLGITTIGIVTKPFKFEGVQKLAKAEAGIEKLGKLLNGLIVLPNDQLSTSVDKISIDAFSLGDVVITKILRRIIDALITGPSTNPLVVEEPLADSITEFFKTNSLADTDFANSCWLLDGYLKITPSCYPEICHSD